MDFDKELDASGLACPLPVVKTRKALKDLAAGQVLKVLSTDPGSAEDLPVFVEQSGDVLLSSGREADRYVFFIRKV